MATALALGFENPPVQSSLAFRTFMDAMARPGEINDLVVETETPDGLNSGSTLIMLTLVDHETPVWLDPEIRNEAVEDYLRFHCNAPIVETEQRAMFAFFAACPKQETLARFSKGTPEYPDASTTFIVEVGSFEQDGDFALSGPGIKSVNRFGATGLNSEIWEWMKQNNARFPLGNDVFLVSDKSVVALPRSVRVMEVA